MAPRLESFFRETASGLRRNGVVAFAAMSTSFIALFLFGLSLLIGTSDLTAELGISGQIGHAKVLEAYETVGAACRTAGKALGMGGVYDKENASRYIKSGARLVLSGSDHNYILAGAKARSELLRAAV